MSNVLTEKIGDGIEVMIEGLPRSVATPTVQAQAALALIQHGIPLGLNFTAGVIGGMRDGSLKISGEIYRFKFAIVAQRAITALEVYSQAIQYIEFQKAYGRFDSQLADDTIDYLRRDLNRRQEKWLRG